MTTTYSGDPSSSTADAVRCLLGDIGTDGAWYLTDEEIRYFSRRTTQVYGDPLMTAAVCADVLAGRFATEVSINADDATIGADQLQTKFEQLAATLRRTYKELAGVAGPVAGGIDRFTVHDPCQRPLSFAVGMTDNLEAGRQNWGDRRELFWDDEFAWLESGPA